jgi:signal peptidase II
MILLIAIILGSVFLDQLTKWLAVIYLQGNPSVPIIPEVFQLTYLENPGAAFGMLQNNRWVFLIVSTVGILAVFLYLLMKRPTSKLLCLSLSFIVGGGIGNMIDRVLLGYVVDFFDFCLINFAIFNVADSFVCVGAGLLSLWVILDTIAEEKRLKAEKAAKEAAAKTEEKAHE